MGRGRRLRQAPARAHKYGVAPAPERTVDGILFASKLESRRYSGLKILLEAQRIHTLELQPRYPCRVNGKQVCTYVADFRYVDEHGRTVVEDAKGLRTPLYKLKKKIVEALYDFEIQEYVD